MIGVLFTFIVNLCDCRIDNRLTLPDAFTQRKEQKEPFGFCLKADCVHA